MPVLVEIDFPFAGPWGEGLAARMGGLAGVIADEPGLIWKIWVENAGAGKAGGVYLFADEVSAQDYVDRHTVRLADSGIGNVSVRKFDVNMALSGVTRGPVAD